MASSRKNFTRLMLFVGLAAALVLPLSVSAKAQSGASGLKAAVVEEMGVESNTSARSFAQAKKSNRTQVNVMRGNGRWAFGATVIEAPKQRGHYPKGWLFVAKEAGEGWDVALEGSPAFANLTSQAPENVVNKGEKGTFSAARTTRSTNSAGPLVTGLMLPWRKGGAWRMTGGPHGWATGFDRPYAALDFAGPNANDQRVRAAGGGRVYTMCAGRRGWIRIYHPTGFSTDYYHLINNIRPKQGGFIRVGTILGLTGNDVSCGGASFGRHVHFALLRGTNHVAVHGRVIGGWRFVQGEAYRGYAHRGRNARLSGNLLYNFGQQL